MKMNLIEMEGLLHGNGIPGDLKVNESNASYLVRKFSELEAKCSALAAENAALKLKGRELLGEACSVYEKFNATVDHEVGNFADGQTLQEFDFLLSVGVPVTGAFLSEVRAQGVEMVIAYHRERADALHHVDRNNAIRHSMAALDASDVAAQLRQEAAQ